MATVFDENFWDERYGSGGAVWSGRPNPQLVAEAPWLASADALVPRTALDVGCGEGADSVWLARRGWQVTAVDFSRVALHRAQDHAAAGARRPDAPGLFFTANDVAAMLGPDLWTVEVAESRPRTSNGNGGESITINDEVVRAVRLG